MKLPRAPHRWDLTPRQAIAVQRDLAGRIEIAPPAAPIRTVAGLDAAFSRDGEHCIGGVVLWDVETRAVVESHATTRKLRFPYVPGLLSFRETPALLAALAKLRNTPDAILCDGHGFAHPRRFGIACHVGVLTGIATAGCAKSVLVGRHREPGRRRGARTRLIDGDEVLGSALRTRDGTRPVFVSVGHRIDQASAERLVLRCAVGYRLPEPTRLADKLVAAYKRESAGSSGESGRS